MRFYATFGVQYGPGGVEHPTLPWVDRDGVLEVVAPDEETARRMVASLTEGDGGVAHYAGLYRWDGEAIRRWYPRGVIARLSLTLATALPLEPEEGCYVDAEQFDAEEARHR